MVDAIAYAEQAYSYRDSHIPYKELDCQAFVEKVLRDCGVSRNWRGSNDMWRSALKWRGTYTEALVKFGCIPRGAWLFTVKQDGGEKKRGYNDSDGNACHVGIFTGQGYGAMHSTTGGVQQCAGDDKRWTHVGLATDIDYNVEGLTDREMLEKILAYLEILMEVTRK